MSADSIVGQIPQTVPQLPDSAYRELRRRRLRKWTWTEIVDSPVPVSLMLVRWLQWMCTFCICEHLSLYILQTNVRSYPWQLELMPATVRHALSFLGLPECMSGKVQTYTEPSYAWNTCSWKFSAKLGRDMGVLGYDHILGYYITLCDRLYLGLNYIIDYSHQAV